MRKQVYRYTTLSTGDDEDIVFATYLPKLEITLEIAQELVENRMEFCQGKPHYLLIDFTHVRSVTKEAKDFMNSHDGGLKGIIAGAFLSNNVVATLFINLYLKVSSPVVPAKFFTSRAEALNWLVRIKDERTITI